MPIKQLIINPGSTSTKLAVYEDDQKLFQETVDHSAEELAQFETLPDQVPYRMELIKNFLERHGISLFDLSGVMGRGGMVWGIETGGYRVGDDLVRALSDEELSSPHASNLGGLIGKRLADEAGIPAFIYDPVTGASLPEVAKVTGFPELPRKSTCHVLNSRAMAIKYAQENGFKNTRVFIDDGWSGTNFARPAFTEIMELAEKGLISTLIVKNHFRLGRNRLIVGQLLEEGFDNLGVRYIAIMDNIDTKSVLLYISFNCFEKMNRNCLTSGK